MRSAIVMPSASGGSFDPHLMLELAQDTPNRFKHADPSAKRDIFKAVLSNCIYSESGVQVSYNEPFDIIAETNANLDTRVPLSAQMGKWLADKDSNLDVRHQKPLSCH